MNFSRLLFFFSLAVTNYSNAQKSSTIQEITTKIGENNYITYEPDGFFASDSSLQFKLYAELAKKASIEQLIKLTDHNKPAVRVYAFMALEKRKYQNLFPIIQKHINDNEEVKTYIFDLKQQKKVGDFFIASDNISSQDRITLDSLLFFTKNELTYTNLILTNIEPSEKNYKRIRELAKDREFAAIALAQYQKETDVKYLHHLILKNHQFSLEAIEYFPHPDFKNTLTLLQKQGGHYFGEELAIAAFKDQFSVDYFSKTISKSYVNNTMRKNAFSPIFDAMTRYQSPVFKNLYFKIWEESYLMNTEVFNYLKETDPAKSYKIVLKCLQNSTEMDNSSLIIDDYLDYIITVNKNDAIELISEKLVHENVTNYKYFAQSAQQLKNEKIIESLFIRLKTENNPHVYIPIVETIITYKNESLNFRLLNILKDNKNIQDWGLMEVSKILDKENLSLL